MNSIPRFRVVAVLLMTLIGCGESRPVVTPKAAPSAKASADPTATFQEVVELLRYPENPRAGDDWTRARDGLQRLSGYFSRPEVQARLKLAPAEREFLIKDVHLSESELTDVESSAFRYPDAHYLDECALLRDAARLLDVQGSQNTTDRAQHYFRWVMRNVYLNEQGDHWIPNAFVLRRGFGTALERALVFLAILRQANIEGCLVVGPEREPKQLLVAVLDEKTSRLLLFDPRLGMALPGKNDKGVLALSEALENPALLEPFSIAKDDVKKLEAWLVCPLQALSPRMLELQRGLSAHTPIVLHQNAKGLHDHIAGASKIPARVWNADLPALPGKGEGINSPTRCLSFFLPKEDGGLDEGSRIAEFMQSREPTELVSLHYAQINLRAQVMPKAAYERLMGLSQTLFASYDLQMRELCLRGRFEPAIRRQERLQAFTRNEQLIGLEANPVFRKDLENWREKLIEVNTQALNSPDDPRVQAWVQQNTSMLWHDRFIEWLVNLNSEKQPERERGDKSDQAARVPILTGILAVGMREYFDFELARWQASVRHEKAARAQAQLESAAKPTPAAQTRSREAWIMARSAWSNFYLDRIALQDLVDRRLKLIQRQHPVLKIGLLEHLNQDIHKYFEARERLAECVAALDGAKAAQEYRRGTRAEIEAWQKKAPFAAELQSLRQELGRLRFKEDSPQEQQRKSWERRTEQMARDWSETGSFSRMQQAIAVTNGVGK
jgi:hypothetical protein